MRKRTIILVPALLAAMVSGCASTGGSGGPGSPGAPGNPGGPGGPGNPGGSSTPLVPISANSSSVALSYTLAPPATAEVSQSDAQWSWAQNGDGTLGLTVNVDGKYYNFENARLLNAAHPSIQFVDAGATGDVSAHGWLTEHAGALMFTSMPLTGWNPNDPYYHFLVSGVPTDAAQLAAVNQYVNYTGLYELQTPIDALSGPFQATINFWDDEWTMELQSLTLQGTVGQGSGALVGSALTGTITTNLGTNIFGDPDGIVSTNTVSGQVYGPNANAVGGVMSGQTADGYASYGIFLGETPNF